MFGIRVLINFYIFFLFFLKIPSKKQKKKKKGRATGAKEKQAHNFLCPCRPLILTPAACRLPSKESARRPGASVRSFP